MKLALKITLIILVVLAFLNLFFWVLAHGSGHRVPTSTDNAVVRDFLILVCLIGVTIWLRRVADKKN